MASWSPPLRKPWLRRFQAYRARGEARISNFNSIIPVQIQRSSRDVTNARDRRRSADEERTDRPFGSGAATQLGAIANEAGHKKSMKRSVRASRPDTRARHGASPQRSQHAENLAHRSSLTPLHLYWPIPIPTKPATTGRSPPDIAGNTLKSRNPKRIRYALLTVRLPSDGFTSRPGGPPESRIRDLSEIARLFMVWLLITKWLSHVILFL